LNVSFISILRLVLDLRQPISKFSKLPTIRAKFEGAPFCRIDIARALREHGLHRIE